MGLGGRGYTSLKPQRDKEDIKWQKEEKDIYN